MGQIAFVGLAFCLDDRGGAFEVPQHLFQVACVPHSDHKFQLSSVLRCFLPHVHMDDVRLGAGHGARNPRQHPMAVDLQHAMSRMLKGSVPVAGVVELDLKVSGP